MEEVPGALLAVPEAHVLARARAYRRSLRHASAADARRRAQTRRFPRAASCLTRPSCGRITSDTGEWRPGRAPHLSGLADASGAPPARVTGCAWSTCGRSPARLVRACARVTHPRVGESAPGGFLCCRHAASDWRASDACSTVGVPMRFCQKCSRFHTLDAFEVRACSAHVALRSMRSRGPRRGPSTRAR
jgi:hypothetical protein